MKEKKGEVEIGRNKMRSSCERVHNFSLCAMNEAELQDAVDSTFVIAFLMLSAVLYQWTNS